MNLWIVFGMFWILTIPVALLLGAIGLLASARDYAREDDREQEISELERIHRMPSLTDEERARFTLYRSFGGPR